MEYCAGGSVSDLMRAADAPLSEDLIAFVTANTLAGLAYLHSVGKVPCSCCANAPAIPSGQAFRLYLQTCAFPSITTIFTASLFMFCVNQYVTAALVQVPND